MIIKEGIFICFFLLNHALPTINPHMKIITYRAKLFVEVAEIINPIISNTKARTSAQFSEKFAFFEFINFNFVINHKQFQLHYISYILNKL